MNPEIDGGMVLLRIHPPLPCRSSGVGIDGVASTLDRAELPELKRRAVWSRHRQIERGGDGTRRDPDGSSDGRILCMDGNPFARAVLVPGNTGGDPTPKGGP
jgi:hypothetical protein